ncbi:MAG: hypothetical protein GY856_07680 [bacterium]|nr:hypothetical protein [bacterium]
MKKLGLLIALITATLITVGVSFAGEEHEIQYRIKVALDDDGELVDIEFDDMEVGEARQFFTDSGKEVTVTRTEEGHKLEVDGREIDLGMHGPLHKHHGAHVGIHKCGKSEEGEKGPCCEGASKIVIHKTAGDGETEATAEVFVMVGDGEDHHLEHFGGHHERVEVLMDHSNILEHLLESGVLDELDPEARQKIIDTLKEIEPEEGKKVIRLKTKRIVVDEEDEDS